MMALAPVVPFPRTRESADFDRAGETVRLCAEAGVRLTPAGAAFPGGDDPEDSHIRLAPSFPPLAEVDRAMEVFVTGMSHSGAAPSMAGSPGRSPMAPRAVVPST